MVLTEAVYQAFEHAIYYGIYGYRFFEYMMLTQRFAAGQTTCYTFSHTIMPYISP